MERLLKAVLSINVSPLKRKMLRRRDFFRLSFLAGLTSLAGCSRGFSQPIFRCTAETLPKEWLRILPKPWIFKTIKPRSLLDPSAFVLDPSTDLLAIGDGWISELSREVLQPIGAELLLPRLSNQAQEFLTQFGSDFATRVFPIGVTPWVMLFRNGEDFLPKAKEGWDVLLEPELTGKVVLPKSPRLVMSLAERLDMPDGLRRLRLQALTYDDRNGINWVLSGKARVAVMPLDRCFDSLRRDPRLSIGFPFSGTPLHWTVLIRPMKTNEPVPQSWIKESWEMPLLGKLLSRGWIPPLPYEELLPAIANIPDIYKPIVLPPKLFWENCWSFPLITTFEMTRLENLWSQSAP